MNYSVGAVAIYVKIRNFFIWCSTIRTIYHIAQKQWRSQDFFKGEPKFFEQHSPGAEFPIDTFSMPKESSKYFFIVPKSPDNIFTTGNTVASNAVNIIS